MLSVATCHCLHVLMCQVYGVRTRARAVNIFDTCAGMLATMNELQKVIWNRSRLFQILIMHVNFCELKSYYAFCHPTVLVNTLFSGCPSTAFVCALVHPFVYPDRSCYHITITLRVAGAAK